MTADEHKLILSLVKQGLPQLEFLRQFRGATDPAKLTASLLEDAFTNRNADDVEYALMVGFTFVFSDARADVVIRTKTGVPVEAKITSGEVKVFKTGGSVRISSVSGDVEVREVEGTVEVNVVSGDVRIEDAKASILTVESKSGDIHLTKVSGSLNVRTSSGDVMARNCSARTFSVEAASGDVDLDISQPVEGAINVRTVSGSIKIDVPDGSDARVMLSTLRGSVSTSIELLDETQEKLTINGRLGEGSGSIDASAVNGDVHLGLRASGRD